MSRVVLAMSGGVDSSVAAHLLRAAGHEVIGVFMRHGEAVETSCTPAAALDEPSATLSMAERTAATNVGEADRQLAIAPAAKAHKQGCCSASDAEDARRVAERLDIPFYAIDFQDEFSEIIDYFVAEYSAARTPNPCVVCNNWLKFGKLFAYADAVDAEYVATGHYARLVRDGSSSPPALHCGVDNRKDQSYVLFGIEARRFARMMLPVGEFRKDQIRAMAGNLGLNVADKRDSQEICFVADGDHASFIRRRSREPRRTGEIVTTDGRVVGHHDGLEQFTIGQRKGLGVALGEPRFVIHLEKATGRVVIGRREELARTELTANRTNWLVAPPVAPMQCLVKIRYNSPRTPATVCATDDRLHVTFDEPQFGVAPGQAVVCYAGDRVLGGGWIE